MLKNRADWKTLCYVVISTGLLVLNWNLPEFHWIPYLASCYAAVCISSLVHNHMHVNIFTWKPLNVAYDYWLTIFYGYPVFAWIPTHNQNHHVYNNREGDFAASYVVSEKNNLLTLLSYPAVSGGIQQKVVREYVKKLWVTQRGKALYCLSQFAFIAAYLGIVFFLDWKKALLYVFIPQQICLNMVLIFNYIQHIHCDEESKFNHSRNIVGPFMNFFLLNNGYHTVHHMKPLLHWSELKGQHQKIAHQIDPRVNETSFIWMMFRFYFLGIFFPSFRSENLRAARILAGKLKEQPSPRRSSHSAPLEAGV